MIGQLSRNKQDIVEVVALGFGGQRPSNFH